MAMKVLIKISEVKGQAIAIRRRATLDGTDSISAYNISKLRYRILLVTGLIYKISALNDEWHYSL